MGRSIDYGLLGGSALAQCSVVPGEIHGKMLDESNAFTFVVTPEPWWEYMKGPVIAAGDLPAEWTQGRREPHIKIQPRYTRLGKGHAHAAFILFQINLCAAARAIRAGSRLGVLGVDTRALNI